MDVTTRTPYLLDTNTVGYIVGGRSQAARRAMVEGMDHARVTISTITEAEILYGLAKRPEATRLRAAVEALLESVEILAWDSAAAAAYGALARSAEWGDYAFGAPAEASAGRDLRDAGCCGWRGRVAS
jgi:tRNA(fMet)-specific endonuclease VapC